MADWDPVLNVSEPDSLARAVSPGPRARAVVVIGEDAFVFGAAFERPWTVPAQPVQAVRFGREIGGKRHLAPLEAEAPVADAVAIRHEREAARLQHVVRARR